jgi:hypothetical protein
LNSLNTTITQNVNIFLQREKIIKMKVTFVMLLVCMVVMTAAGTSDKKDEPDMPELSKDQRVCIADLIKTDDTIFPALKKCHTDNGGLACIKAIPQLSTCFA